MLPYLFHKCKQADPFENTSPTLPKISKRGNFRSDEMPCKVAECTISAGKVCIIQIKIKVKLSISNIFS